MQPTPEDIKFIFEGNKEAIDKFIEGHKAELDELYVDYDELNELKKEGDLASQRLQIFSFLYTVAIDWREYDSEIVNLLAKMIPDESVEVEENDEGLLVTYNGTEHQLMLTFSPADRYVTIRGFNEIVKPKYEARIVADSFFSDTHSLLVLPNETWAMLEQKYFEQLDKLFMKITEATDFP